MYNGFPDRCTELTLSDIVQLLDKWSSKAPAILDFKTRLVVTEQSINAWARTPAKMTSEVVRYKWECFQCFPAEDSDVRNFQLAYDGMFCGYGCVPPVVWMQNK